MKKNERIKDVFLAWLFADKKTHRKNKTGRNAGRGFGSRKQSIPVEYDPAFKLPKKSLRVKEEVK